MVVVGRGHWCGGYLHMVVVGRGHWCGGYFFSLSKFHVYRHTAIQVGTPNNEIAKEC